jgi:hypothetical protein
MAFGEKKQTKRVSKRLPAVSFLALLEGKLHQAFPFQIFTTLYSEESSQNEKFCLFTNH